MSTPDQTHGHECPGDAAAFVLGALEPDEARSFLAHLEECAVCQDEVDSLGGVVQVLPMAAPQHPAPRRLRRRIMRRVRETPQRESESRARRARAIAWPPSRVLAGALAGAVLVAAVAIGVGLSLPGSAARVIQARVTGIPGQATLRITGSHGELVVRDLPQPPPGQVYEVWLKTPNRPPVPANALFSVTARGSADLGLPVGLTGVSQVLVTVEPDGGTPAPTHPPVIVAELT